MRLTLLRHAKTEAQHSGQEDWDRMLEPRGQMDAPEMARRLLYLFASLNKLGTTIIVATHDLHLLTEVTGAEMLRLDRGQIADPTGALRHPPRRAEL